MTQIDLESFPDEILEDVALCLLEPSLEKGGEALNSLLRSCRLFYRIVVPVLYRDLTRISGASQIFALTRTLRNDSRLAAFVLRAEIFLSPHHGYTVADVAPPILPFCCSLNLQLVDQGVDLLEHPVPDREASGWILSCPQLKTLTLPNSIMKSLVEMEEVQNTSNLSALPLNEMQVTHVEFSGQEEDNSFYGVIYSLEDKIALWIAIDDYSLDRPIVLLFGTSVTDDGIQDIGAIAENTKVLIMAASDEGGFLSNLVADGDLDIEIYYEDDCERAVAVGTDVVLSSVERHLHRNVEDLNFGIFKKIGGEDMPVPALNVPSQLKETCKSYDIRLNNKTTSSRSSEFIPDFHADDDA
jgi:hypothetical protein